MINYLTIKNRLLVAILAFILPFSFARAEVKDALSADTDATFSLKNGAIPQEKTAEGVKLRVSMASAKAEGSRKSSSQQSLTANMKVKVRMEQADMPGGLANLLHLTTNNLQMEAVEEGKEANHDE